MIYTDEIRARHVFGELTLGDIWPSLSKGCAEITVVWHEDKDGWRRRTASRHFSDHKVCDNGLQLVSGYPPDPLFPFKSKVLVKKDHLKVEFNGRWVELHLFRLEPMQLEIV